jgi:hypothetical protein
MNLTTVIAGAAGHAFSAWMPLEPFAFAAWMPRKSFAPVTFAAATTAAGPNAVRLIVCGALTPRDVEPASEFYPVIASLLRRALVTGDFGATQVPNVWLPTPMKWSGSPIDSLVSCLQSLDCGTHRERSLFELEADFSINDATAEALLAPTCAVIRCHRLTLRRLKVPWLSQYQEASVPPFAQALSECTAITSLDLSRATFPFRSWQQLGPTLRTLKLKEIRGDGTDTTFRLLADNMTALRELELFTLGQPSQDGFIELVSRLRSLSLRARSRPWDAVRDASAWPLTLPNLQELTWLPSFGTANAVAVAILRRALSLRAAHVSHASALAAVEEGPVASVHSNGDATVPLSPPSMQTPLSNIQTLTVAAVTVDPASLVKILTASPRLAAVRLQWDGAAPGFWGLLHAAASAAALGEEEGARWRRVRRVGLDVYFSAAMNPTEAARCVCALFPRARYASWTTNRLPEMQLFPV